MSYSYSLDGEIYIGPFETRDLAEAEAKERGLKHFWTGENKEPEILEAINASEFLENIKQIDGLSIEPAADWPECTEKEENDLTEMLRQTFMQWMKKYDHQPTFWVVENVEEHFLP